MGKAFTFFATVWIIVCLAGGVMQGSVQVATTVTTTAITADGDTVYVNSTEGFPEPGIIVIEDERIAYSDTTATTFRGTLAQPLVRGVDGTEAVVHDADKGVRTVEGAMLNTTITYNVAVIADAAGLWGMVEISLAVLRIIGSFLILPLSFLGTDLAVIGILWTAAAAGMLVSVGIALAGGRRV